MLSRSLFRKTDAKSKLPTIDTVYDLGDKIGEGQFADVFNAKVREAGGPPTGPTPCSDSVSGWGTSSDFSSRCSPYRSSEGKVRYVPWHVAVKSINKSKVTGMDDLNREVELMQSLAGHPHIVQLYEVFDDSRHMHLVLELMSGGNLFDHIVNVGVCTEGETAEILTSVCSALDHMHQRMIVHRDVKPEK